VYLNGQLLIQGSSEAWVETSPGSGTFDFNDPPLAGDEISVSYQTIGGVIGSGDRTDQAGGTNDTYGILSGSIDGSNATFTASAGEYVSGTLYVYLNGQLQTQGANEDWVETNSDVGVFDFNTPPVAGDVITITYKIHGAGAGDADTLDGYHASDFAPADQSGEAVLGSSFTIEDNAQWVDTGLSISLPAAGKYELHGNVRGNASASITGTNRLYWMSAMLYDATADEDVENSERLIVLTGASNTAFQMTAPLYKQITVSQPTTIKLYVRRDTNDTPVGWTYSLIESNSAGRTTLAYKLIST
jgi:hypothetical protein